MEIMIDSASIENIKRIQEYIDVEGVTTNPSILAKSKMGLNETLVGISDVLTKEQMLFVQVVSTDYAEMMKEAEYISKLHHGNAYAKIPVTKEGLRAIRECHTQGIKTLATAIYTMEQGILAVRAGAEYLAPYVNRMDNITSAEYEIGGICDYILRNESSSKIVAASFKNLSQVKTMITLGVDAMTLPVDIIDSMLNNLNTIDAVDKFSKDFDSAFNQNSIIE